MPSPRVATSVKAFVGALLRGDARNGWVHGGGLKLYLRRGYHMINDEITMCIDVANVAADNPGNGAFTAFLDWLEPSVALHSGVVFVENILSPRLHQYLEARGYQPHGQTQGGHFHNRFKELRHVEAASHS